MSADYPESFAGYPESVTERKSNKEGNAALWTPRDALIAILRKIDTEKLNVDALIICFRETVAVGDTVTSYANATPNIHTALGLMDHVAFKMMTK